MGAAWVKVWHVEKIAKSWTGLCFKGLVMDIKSKQGAGRNSSRPTRGPRAWEVMGPFAVLSRRAGWAFCRVMWNLRIEPRLRSDRNLLRLVCRVLAFLAHHFRAVSRGMFQPENLGFAEASAYGEGAALFLQPLFLPASHHPARGSW